MIARLSLAATFIVATCSAFTGCMTPPDHLDLAREKASEAGLYRVAVMAPAPMPAVALDSPPA